MSRRRLSSLGVAGAAILSFVTLVALTAPVIAPFSPTERAGRPFERPSSRHLLGTDDLGHDLFTLLLHGTRSSLLIGVASALFAIIVGFAVALVAGYFRGRVEAVLMRIVDLMIAFPFFVLVVVLSAFFGQGLLTTIAVIGLVIWARPARVLRSQVLRIRELDHVVVATSMGAPAPRIILRHIMPRVAPLAAAQFVQAANVAVLVEASLSFLGLGDPGRVSWGTTLFFAQARNAFLTDAWIWWVLPPGIALTLVIVGFAYLGQAVEELADPRLTIKRTGVRRRALRARVADPVPGADPVLQASHFDVEYRSGRRPLRALSDVGLRVGRGSIVGLVGESGSGKSTLVMTALGMLRPPGLMNGGNMFLNGRDIGLPARTGVAAVRGREIALIPQNAMSSLNPAYPVARQVSEAAALTTSETVAAERARDLLELVGIEPERHGAFPHELSGGMRQRVLIAMALANDPTVIVADEPVSGLDVVTQAGILALLTDLRDRLGVGILIVSHDLPVVSRVADEIVVLYAGRVVESGETSAVIADPVHPYTRLLLHAYPSLRGERRALTSIAGDPPDLARLPSGCAFHPRCPQATQACCEWNVELLPTNGHLAACLVEAS